MKKRSSRYIEILEERVEKHPKRGKRNLETFLGTDIQDSPNIRFVINSAKKRERQIKALQNAISREAQKKSGQKSVVSKELWKSLKLQQSKLPPTESEQDESFTSVGTHQIDSPILEPLREASEPLQSSPLTSLTSGTLSGSDSKLETKAQNIVKQASLSPFEPFEDRMEVTDAIMGDGPKKFPLTDECHHYTRRADVVWDIQK